MRIEKKQDETIRFRDLKQGDVFVFSDGSSNLLMKTNEVDERGIVYNCVELKYGKMYASDDTLMVKKVDAYIVQ